jgi:O-methyltransferase
MRVHPVYSSEEVLMFTYKMSIDILEKDIKGDFIECGVAAGSQIGAMQQAMLDKQISRTIWGFDSFEGIPFAGINDTEQPGIGEININKIGVLETTSIASYSQEDVLKNFQLWNLPTNNLKLIKGWFENTIEPTSKEIKEIAMLRLDGDLYSSTYVCLEHLFEKVVIGGIIIIDDWNLTGCQKAVKKFIDGRKIKKFNEIAYFIK